MAQHRQEYRIQWTTEAGEQEHLLGPEGAGIGRETGNNIVLVSGLISRRHARIEVQEDGCRIIDLDSANGTYLNGKRLEPNLPLPLKHEDVIRIGEYELHYLQKIILSESAKAAPKESGPSSKESATQPVRKAPIAAVQQKTPPPRIPPADAEWAEACRENPLQALGLDQHSLRLLDYLPGIYHTDFVSRFLGLFESILLPIEWTIENFDLFLAIGTCPQAFMAWLEQWFVIFPDHAWLPDQRRLFLKEAAALYQRRGTPAALTHMLEIFTEQKVNIEEWIDEEDPFLFQVRLPKAAAKLSRESINRIIELNKPAHCHYILTFDL
jgi:phage tail-like protein